MQAKTKDDCGRGWQYCTAKQHEPALEQFMIMCGPNSGFVAKIIKCGHSKKSKRPILSWVCDVHYRYFRE